MSLLQYQNWIHIFQVGSEVLANVSSRLVKFLPFPWLEQFLLVRRQNYSGSCQGWEQKRMVQKLGMNNFNLSWNDNDHKIGWKKYVLCSFPESGSFESKWHFLYFFLRPSDNGSIKIFIIENYESMEYLKRTAFIHTSKTRIVKVKY